MRSACIWTYCNLDAAVISRSRRSRRAYSGIPAGAGGGIPFYYGTIRSSVKVSYGPYQLPGAAAQDSMGNAVTVFMNISGFDFYGSWLLGATFYKSPAVSVSPGVQFQKGVGISH